MIFNDFAQRYTPKSIADIVFSSDNSRQLIEDIVTGDRPFPIPEGKNGILLYGVPGTGKSALANLLPNAIERARGGTDACERYIRVEAGNNGLTMMAKVSSAATFIPIAKFHYFVLDEVDNLNKDAMKILKSTMNYPNTVFVLTTNNFDAIEAGVKDRCHCIPFNAAPAANWRPLARRILVNASVEGVTDEQLDAIIKPCNGSARQIADAIVELVLAVQRTNATPKA